MGGWTSIDRETNEWDGTIRAKKFLGDGSALTNIPAGAIGAGIGGGTAGSVLFVASSGAFIGQDNAQLYWDDTNNRLGIGTANPTYLLDVAGVINATSFTRDGTAAAYYGPSDNALLFGSGYIQNGGGYFDFYLGGSGSSTMRFSGGSGNVGIGATTPSEKLQVSGAILLSSASGAIYLPAINQPSSILSSSGALYIATSGALYFKSSAGTVTMIAPA